MLWLLIICILDTLFCTRTVTDFRKFPLVAHKMVREATSQMDQGLWRTIIIVDLYHRNIALKVKQTPAKPHKLIAVVTVILTIAKPGCNCIYIR